MPKFSKDKDRAIRWARRMMEQEQGFLVLDTETTGLNHDDEAVAIGLVNHQGEVLLDTLLRHTKRSEPGAEAVHGITWEMTREAPPFAEVYPRLYEVTSTRPVIGYNLTFDLRIILQTLDRYRLPFPDEIIRANSDVMFQFAPFYGDWSEYHGSYTWKKLTVAAQHFGLDTGQAHGAVADALLTLGVVKGMAAARLRGEGQ